MASTIRNADGTYTTTLTPREQAIVLKLAALQNVSAATVVETLLERKLREIFVQYRDREAAARQEAYDTASAATKATVDTALNFTPET